MQSLMDMLTQGANGEMIDRIGRQYGLSSAQAEQAVAALLPAFSQGLKRNAHDPHGFTRFLDALSSGRHAAYYDDPGQALGDRGIEEGNAILGHLFGSRELSRAVAAQAAQATGISQSILKSMLPALAPMILGGLFKQLSGATQPGRGQALDNPLGRMFEQMSGGAAPANPWGRMLEELMGGAAKAPAPPSPRSGPGSANPWGKMMEDMMRGRMPGQAGGASAQADNPLGRIFEEMIRGGGAVPPASQPVPDPEPEPRHEPGQEAPTGRTRQGGDGGLGDLFGEMFETGRGMQKDYQRNMESIFDQFLDGMKPR
ncbi:MAG: DUF937 domain-containing protein [Pseudomonadota bacterium]|nr:DUF937 domain-containing protein [Pseudomonadota bacterium]